MFIELIPDEINPHYKHQKHSEKNDLEVRDTLKMFDCVN